MPRKTSKPQRTTPDQPLSLPVWARFAALMLMAMALYIPSLGNEFIWDDDQYVTLNPTLRSVEGLRQIWFELRATPQYYPMVFTTFWVEHKLWAFNPAGYHATNVLLHALGAGLLWLVLRKLKVPGAWLAAAVFAAHPVHVESVAWVTERKNVLSAVFYFLAALAYLRFAPLDDQASESKAREWRWYVLAVLLFALALFSKTVTCTFPTAILLMTWWKKGKLGWRDVLPTIPLFALGASMGLLTAWMEHQHVWGGTTGFEYSLLERCLIAGRVAWFYAGKLLWPAELIFFYPRWTIDAGAWQQYLYPLGAIAVVATLFLLRNRIGRGPVVAVLFFGGTLFPALGFFDVYPFQFSFVADHFQHLASIGFTTLVVAAIVWTIERRGGWRTPHTAGAVVVLAMLGHLTWRQQAIYKNPETLWADTLAKNDDAWLAHCNYGVILAARNELDQAMHHYRRSIELRPGYAYSHYNLANALMKLGDDQQAIEQYRLALEANPRMSWARFNLAMTLVRAGSKGEAIEHFKQAALDSQNSAWTWYQVGLVLLDIGEPELAVEHLRQAQMLDPSRVETATALARALWALGRHDEAIVQYRRAVELQPRDGQNRMNLATALLSRDQIAAAQAEFRIALRLAPTASVILEEIAGGLAQSGQFAKAVAVYDVILEANPSNERIRRERQAAAASAAAADRP